MRIALSVVCLTLVSLVGCGGGVGGPATVPAEGVVTLDGAPVEGATIVFIDANGSSNTGNGFSDAEGKFALSFVEGKSGIVPGTYMATIQKNVEIKLKAGDLQGEEGEHAAEGGGDQAGVENILPLKYQSPKPDFTFTVPQEGTTDLKIELTSK